jgi:hypothetical protein
VKRLVTTVTLGILLARLILFGLRDIGIYVIDTGTSNNEVKSSISMPIKNRDFWAEIRAKIR